MDTDPTEDIRVRVLDAGLGRQADAILDGGRPSIRLRSHPTGLAYPLPAIAPTLDNGVIAVASSGWHHLALRSDGTVSAWGANGQGQLGDGTQADRRLPYRVPGVRRAVAISAGWATSLALLEDGSVLGWGSNRLGELGGEPGPEWLFPAPVAGLERDVVVVGAGPPTVALTGDGRAWRLGQGMGEAPGALDHSPMPLLVEAPTPVRRFGGPGDRVAVLDDGTVVGWPGPTLGASPPEPLAGLDDVVVALGLPTMGLALRADGSVTAWGASFCGQLGNGTTDHADRPVAVTGIGAVVDIAAMGGSRFALGADGSVWAWGAGDGGRLGLGTSENALAPVAVPGLARGVQAIAPGIALKEDGSVWSWGGERLPEGLGADASLQLGATKLGGRPDVPVGFRWPAGDNQPMSFLAQVNLADVAPFDRDRLLPPSGLLSFFYRWPDDPFAEPAHAVFVTEAGVPLLRADYPAELPAKRRERAVVLVPEADFTLHPWGPASLTHDERGAYRYGVLPQPEEVVHRMLGHPGLVQDAAAPPERVLLLQIDLYDPGSFPDGAGRLHFLIAEDDLAQGRFERVESNYECD